MKYALLVGLGLSLVACRGNKSSDPPVHLIQNMDFQQSYKPQEANPWFLDGRAVRPLPANTVANGGLKVDKAYNEGRGDNGRLLDGLPAGLELNDALLARGQARYDIYCAPCHAKSGYGDGIVVARGLKVPPPSYHTANLKAMPLGYFYEVITKGKGTMMPYAAQIPVDDRWAIAAWVRVLQVSQDAQLADVPAEERQNLEGGR
jgi:mono/diheme cytochrome c family protein